MLLSLDFSFGCLPTTSAGLFRDYRPTPQICKNFFRFALGFSLAQGVFRCFFWLASPFSPGCKDTSSVVSSFDFGFGCAGLCRLPLVAAGSTSGVEASSFQSHPKPPQGHMLGIY